MRLSRLFLALLATLLALVGCGGGAGGGSKARGTASLRIVWPPSTREIPANADQIVVSFFKGTTIATGATPFRTLPTITKPADLGGGVSVVNVDLDADNYVVQATSSKSTDPTHPLSQGTAPLSVQAGKSSPFVVTMATTLARYKITDTGTDDNGSSHAFSPSAFFIDAGGAFTLNGSGNRVSTTPSYNAAHPTVNVQITPQSSGASDLLLLPAPLPSPSTSTGPRLELLVTGGGLKIHDASNPVVPTTSNSSAYSMTLDYAPSDATASSFRLDYYDYVYSESTGSFTASLISSISTPVGIGSNSNAGFKIKVDNLPTDAANSNHRHSYRLKAILRESNTNTAYDGVEFTDSTSMPTVVLTDDVLSFGTVQDNGNGFTVDVTLQLRTEGGGFVDYAEIDDVPVSVTSGEPTVTLTDVSYPTVAIPGTAAAPDQTIRFKRGDSATVTGVKASISGHAYLLDPALFTPAAGAGLGVAVNPVSGLPPVTWTLTATGSDTTGADVTTNVGVTFNAVPSTATKPSNDQAITVIIAPNGGHIGVGVG